MRLDVTEVEKTLLLRLVIRAQWDVQRKLKGYRSVMLEGLQHKLK